MILAAVGLVVMASAAQESEATISEAAADANGFLTNWATSPAQAGRTEIKKALPDRVDLAKRLGAVSVQSADAGVENIFDNTALWRREPRGLRNKRSAVFVVPTFSHLP